MTSNEQLFDALLRHQVGLLRLSGSIRKRIFAVLDQADSAVLDRLVARLGRPDPRLSPMTLLRLARLSKIIKQIRLDAWKEVAGIWGEEMHALVKSEPAFVAGAMQTVLPVYVDFVTPPAELLRSIVTRRPFQGRVLREWASHQSRTDIQRINGQIRVGMIQGDSIQTIGRRVRGGMKMSRRDAEAITRTAVNHYSNQARREFVEANKSVITTEMIVATLDGNTTAICRSLDGRRFKAGVGPIPPFHFGCRTLRTALVDPEPTGLRPMKPIHQKQMLREFAQQKRISVPRSRNKLPYGMKTQFDKFARGRTREMIGRVPARVNYQEWLGRQPVQFQNDTLGVTKARLFRDGKLPLKKFVDRRGHELTLTQLARVERQSFIDAGLDPEKFL